MDFKHLATFVRVAELGSLSKAADRMRIAQPALSRRMRLLEGEIGVKLFARHRRGMQLTQAGEELRARVVGPLRQLDQVFEDVRSLSEAVGGSIALGLPPTTGYVLAGSLARRVAERAPHVSLRIVEGYAGHLIDWLQRGELDMAILYGPACDYEMRVDELLVEQLVLVGAPDCKLRPDVPVRFPAIADLPLVLPSHPNGLRVLVDNVASKTKTRLQVRFQADSFQLMKELVESGLGYTTLPLSSFSREVAAGRLRYAPLIEPCVTRQLVLGMQPGAEVSRAARKLEMLVRQEIASLVASKKWDASLMFDPQNTPGKV